MIDPKILVPIGVGLLGLALAAYLVYRWRHLKSFARDWLSHHPECVKVICGAIQCAANVKQGVNKYVMPIFGVNASGVRTVRIAEEEIDEAQLEQYKKKIKEDPILAVCA